MKVAFCCVLVLGLASSRSNALELKELITNDSMSGWEEKPDDTMKKKLENFSVSYMEAIAGKRQRNVEWAKSAVKESASISAEKALELKVIDLIATGLIRRGHDGTAHHPCVRPCGAIEARITGFQAHRAAPRLGEHLLGGCEHRF